jgi:hypothetical protein
MQGCTPCHLHEFATRKTTNFKIVKPFNDIQTYSDEKKKLRVPVNVVLRVLDSFSEDCLGHVRLIHLLIELRQGACCVKSNVVKSLYLLTERPGLFQMRPCEINIICVSEEHLPNLKMRTSLNFLRQW